MGLNRINTSIRRLEQHWKDQGVAIFPASEKDILLCQQKNSMIFPIDFRKLYLCTNGMLSCYPNNGDKEGFLFYPLHAIKSVKDLFDTSHLHDRQIIIFADYLHESWWYGFEIVNGTYEIGIIPDENTFKKITNSLSEFIEIYINDSNSLYLGES